MLPNDPVVTDLAHELAELGRSDAFEQWREFKLKQFRGDYIYDGDLADAVGTHGKGESLLNRAFAAFRRGESVLGVARLNALLAEAADDYAERQWWEFLKLQEALQDTRKAA